MFTKGVLTIFTWALILEIVVFIYYLGVSPKPVEFYMNLALLIFTVLTLIFLILRERKRRKKEQDEDN
ncbi:MAG: TM0026 family membrane protein [Fervidobacterium sp.]|uniref:TM0026 family membrane protein n=1 Tax=Fervidobacterium sp. TaxID=1871331 RepID=UPI00404B37A3